MIEVLYSIRDKSSDVESENKSPWKIFTACPISFYIVFIGDIKR